MCPSLRGSALKLALKLLKKCLVREVAFTNQSGVSNTDAMLMFRIGAMCAEQTHVQSSETAGARALLVQMLLVANSSVTCCETPHINPNVESMIVAAVQELRVKGNALGGQIRPTHTGRVRMRQCSAD